MAMGGDAAIGKSNIRAKPSAERVVAGFRRMRQQHRSMATKAARLEIEMNEHSLVIDTLRKVNPSQKCYQLVEGVLVERTVKEVLPVVESSKEEISRIVEILALEMQTQRQALKEYREKYSIPLVREEDGPGRTAESSSQEGEGGGAKGGTGILVS